AVAAFSLAGLVINIVGFAGVFAAARIHIAAGWLPLALAMAAGLLPLALLASALQMWISSMCRAAKEAQTYLSMAVFLPMGLGLFQVFFPAPARSWLAFLPVIGQQLQLSAWLKGTDAGFARAAALGCFTAALALLVLQAAAGRWRRDEIIYGG
ncbi:MAG TPA: hypothetical protein VMT86_15145, partial [Bryobacteraceae bacterium]|nr:hypothetical protein [Bryobacteraceae bacterium]